MKTRPLASQTGRGILPQNVDFTAIALKAEEMRKGEGIRQNFASNYYSFRKDILERFIFSVLVVAQRY